MSTYEVSIESRRLDYEIAEQFCTKLAERYIEARAAGRLTRELSLEFNSAERELLRTKRKLEATERRLAKRS